MSYMFEVYYNLDAYLKRQDVEWDEERAGSEAKPSVVVERLRA